MQPFVNSTVDVVMYHYVRDIKSSVFPNIKGLETAQFIEQLKFFKNNYHVITIKDVIGFYDNGEALPQKSMLLTFDDGYQDHYQNVLPILVEYGFEGSFYIPAKSVEENIILDVNKIHHILACCADKQKIIKKIRSDIENSAPENNLGTYDFYYHQHAKASRFDDKDTIFIKRMLQHGLPEKLRNGIVHDLFVMYVTADEVGLSQSLYMSKQQLNEMLNCGMHIGAHGYEHYWWDKLSFDRLETEIQRSKYFLHSLDANDNPFTLSYPFGAYDKKVVDLLMEHDCKLAFTTEVKTANLTNEHRLTLPRYDTYDFPPMNERLI